MIEKSIKKANIEGYRKEATVYDAGMGYYRRDVIEDCLRIKALLGQEVLKYYCKTAVIILEIGVGTGISRKIMTSIFPTAIFIPSDISFQMLKEYGKKHSVVSGVVCDAEYLPFKENAFHIVVCSSFVHHLQYDLKLLSEAHRVSKPEGMFLGIREPKKNGCDFWFRFQHLARRYGDKAGCKLLLKRLVGCAGGWPKIWAHEMLEKDFIALDLMEIRGAILQPTPTKKHGGIDAMVFLTTARKIFKKVEIVPFGLTASFLEFFSILFQIKIPWLLLRLANNIDTQMKLFSFCLPFDSFSFICKKDCIPGSSN